MPISNRALRRSFNWGVHLEITWDFCLVILYGIGIEEVAGIEEAAVIEEGAGTEDVAVIGEVAGIEEVDFNLRLWDP